MDTALKVLAAQLAEFETEYTNLINAIDHAKQYDTPAHVRNLKLLATNQWVRIATVSNLIIDLEKLNKAAA